LGRNFEDTKTGEILLGRKEEEEKKSILWLSEGKF
jgi:hypothetical protein